MIEIFRKQRFGFLMKQRLNNSKNFREKKKSEHSKKHLFLNVWKTWCDVKEIDDGIEENEPEKLN